MQYSRHEDHRGVLEKFKLRLDFLPAEVFFVKDVAIGTIRGAHAHYSCRQLIVLRCGKIKLTLDDGNSVEQRILEEPGNSQMIDEMVWSTQEFLVDKTEIMVFCSENYDKSDYITNYEDFKKLTINNML